MQETCNPVARYVRYRFKTWAADDPRPHKDMSSIGMPWWYTGRSARLTGSDYAICICYLPVDTDLHEYWDDAFDVSSDPADSVEYSARFPKPGWLR